MPTGFLDSLVTTRHPRVTPSLADWDPCRFRRCTRLAGVPAKQRVCAICVDRTRGRTTRVDFGYGVAVWLCAGHAGVGFLTARSGRDAVLTLMRTCEAHGCYTANRKKALDAHLAALRGPRPRRRPGSYAWP